MVARRLKATLATSPLLAPPGNKIADRFRGGTACAKVLKEA